MASPLPCPTCHGEREVQVRTGHRTTGSGMGDAEETWALVPCLTCDADGCLRCDRAECRQPAVGRCGDVPLCGVHLAEALQAQEAETRVAYYAAKDAEAVEAATLEGVTQAAVSQLRTALSGLEAAQAKREAARRQSAAAVEAWTRAARAVVEMREREAQSAVTEVQVHAG